VGGNIDIFYIVGVKYRFCHMQINLNKLPQQLLFMQLLHMQ